MMISGRENCPLGTSLRQLLPGAIIDRLTTQDWHSATFSGQRIAIRMLAKNRKIGRDMEDFRSILPDHDFNLRSCFMADIGVRNIRQTGDNVEIDIDALILEE